MKQREDVARFIEAQMGGDHVCKRDKAGCQHYGWQDLRELLDFIYGSEPLNDKENLVNK